jgi:glycosyltransferase involved in cell wall biosynthesis
VIKIIGAEDATFKRIEDILKAIRIVRQKGYDINLNWISPTMPHINKEAVIVNPEQKVIGDTLRKTDIYVCASRYESFCLPVLEAMTCGACVITTNNGGNMDFVHDKENALLIEKDNIDDIVNKIEYLINNEDYRKELAAHGVEESKKFSWDETMKKIDSYYRNIADYEV